MIENFGFRINDLVYLMECFKRAFIKSDFEFIVAPKTVGGYFKLSNCKDNLDIKARLLECLSREAYKSCPYKSLSLNKDYHKYVASSLNTYFKTNFDEKDFDVIYTYLGNAVRHNLARRFISEGNLSVEWLTDEILKEKQQYARKVNQDSD